MVICFLLVIYPYTVLYDLTYEIPYWENLKLAFISVFLNFKAFLVTLLAIAVILVITWFYKGLLLFGTFGVLVYAIVGLTKDTRIYIDGKLEDELA